MRTRDYIAGVVAMMAAAVLFGIGATAVLATPLNDHAAQLLPLAVVASLVAAPLIGWWLEPRLRSRRHRARDDRFNRSGGGFI